MNEKNPLVVVVDDDISIRDSLKDLISSAGLNVQTFSFGARIFDPPASGCPHLPGARCTAAGIKRS